MRDSIPHANGSWRDVVIDAGIAAGSAFFGTLTGISIAGIRVDPITFLLAGGIAAGGAFFGALVAGRKRGP
jgi:hypothetical protein